MCKFLPVAPRLAGIAAATRHFRALVIVPVLAAMFAFPASAQIISNSESQSTGAAILINIDKSRQKMTVFWTEWKNMIGRYQLVEQDIQLHQGLILPPL